MPLAVESRRKRRSTIEALHPGATLLDVTSRSDEPWVRFSPFYPHGGIPIPGSPEVLAEYADRYLDVVGEISRREGVWEKRGYAVIANVLRWLFPDPLIDDQLVTRYATWLATAEPSEQVRRGVTERLDEARRALRAQERSRIHLRPE